MPKKVVDAVRQFMKDVFLTEPKEVDGVMKVHVDQISSGQIEDLAHLIQTHRPYVSVTLKRSGTGITILVQ